MILKLISVKEYCKRHKITDAAARKHIKQNSVKHCIYDSQTYIILEDNTEEKQRHKIRLLNSNIKALKNEVKQYAKQDDMIEEQKKIIQKLEAKLDTIEAKLEAQYAKKEELYEKVINHMALIENKNKN